MCLCMLYCCVYGRCRHRTNPHYLIMTTTQTHPQTATAARSAFMKEQLASPALGATLAARLELNDPALLPPGQTTRLAGVASLAFDLQDASQRDGLARLADLPGDAAYLSNVSRAAESDWEWYEGGGERGHCSEGVG